MSCEGNIGQNDPDSGWKSIFVKYGPGILMTTSAEHKELLLALTAGLHVCIKKLRKGSGNTRRLLMHMILACAMYFCLKWSWKNLDRHFAFRSVFLSLFHMLLLPPRNSSRIIDKTVHDIRSLLKLKVPRWMLAHSLRHIRRIAEQLQKFSAA